jgi:Flp pilus assembly protein TadD
LKPSAADAYNELGEVALREGDPKGAIASFEKAAELDPKQAAYRLNLDAVRRSVGEKP